MLAFAGFLAYFLEWPISMLARKMPRPAATRIVFYTFFIVLLSAIPTVGAVLFFQTGEFVKALPGYLDQLPNQYDMLNKLVIGLQQRYVQGQEAQGLDIYLRQLAQQLQSSGPVIVSRALGATQNFLSAASTVMAGLIVVPVIALYFLLDARRFRRTLVDCFAERLRPDVESALDAINKSLGGYIYSRVLMALFIGGFMAVFMAAMGVPYWLLLAVGLFVGEFIPVVGGLLAFVPIAIVILVSPQPLDLLWVLGFNLLLQLIQNYIIAPKLAAETMNIHPLTVVVAMLIGGSVGGVAGLLLALPAAAAVKILANIFIFKREERGITLPQLDLISSSGQKIFMEAPEESDHLMKDETD